MKFLNYKHFYLTSNDENSFIEFNNNSMCLNYLNLYFCKTFVKKRKHISRTRFGIVNKLKNSSVNRNKNRSLLTQYSCISHKNGKYCSFFKNINISAENIFYIFKNESDEFKKYKNYINYFHLFNSSYFYSDLNNILDISIQDLESIFEIKTIKNNKKKTKAVTKYSHEIVYIPKKKRFKYIIRALSFYKEGFKNYDLWERVFWSFLLTIINRDNSFLRKRRDYIYSKSVKFFKKKPKK